VRDNPAVVSCRVGIRVALLAVTAGFVLASSASPAAAATGAPTLKLDGPRHLGLLSKVTATGVVPGALPGEEVTVTATASGRQLFAKKVGTKGGHFQVPFVINACCQYSVIAESAGLKSAPQQFTVRVPKRLRKGGMTRLFNRSLQAQGFHTGTRGGRVTSGTHLAIKAFRKVNGMRWSERYSPAIFRTLLQGKGAFQPRFDDGKHVEVDISKQVMALVEGKTPVHTFHVSTGTGGTPTVLGNFRFYLKQPGYNSVRM
jgi:L,D-transpeptidase catalytic domain